MSNSSPAEARYIERMGLLWEAEGLPRIAGRMLGYLALQADAISLDRLAAALQVSKASVSVDARHLERLGLIERISRPGDRRDYYMIAEQMPARVVALKLRELQELQDALADVSSLPTTDSVVQARIVSFRAFHERLLTLMRGLIAALQEPPSLPTTRTIGNPT